MNDDYMCTDLKRQAAVPIRRDIESPLSNSVHMPTTGRPSLNVGSRSSRIRQATEASSTENPGGTPSAIDALINESGKSSKDEYDKIGS